VIRVLLADDQTLVRDGFRSIIEHEDDLEVAGEAADGRDAIERARVLRPDVVLMDIRMPNLDGLEATRRLLADPEPPRVLILTTFDLNEYVYEALTIGASGFLLKDVRAGELTEAIRTVATGESLLSPAITRRLIEQYVRRPAPGRLAPVLRELTERELDVLKLLARGLSNAEIAKQLFLGTSTVKSHVNRILSKLDRRDRVQAVVLAYESGLIQPGDNEIAPIGTIAPRVLDPRFDP
jgi:DNA-binding NarL/FixJ family response regulator